MSVLGAAPVQVFVPTARIGVTNVSPFAAKLEIWLRLAGLPFTLKPANMARAPKGKAPYIEENGALMGDSQLIIAHLKRTRGVTLDDWLSADQLATGQALRRMLEEATYFAITYARWVDPVGWAAYRPIMGTMFPPVVGGLVLPLVRSQVRKATHSQGTGRHSAADVYAMAADDFDALAWTLGDQPYVFGDQPCSLDATAAAWVESVLAFPAESALRDAVREHTNLVAYSERIKARCYGQLVRG